MILVNHSDIQPPIPKNDWEYARSKAKITTVTFLHTRLSGNLLSARGNWALDPETRRPNPD